MATGRAGPAAGDQGTAGRAGAAKRARTEAWRFRRGERRRIALAMAASLAIHLLLGLTLLSRSVPRPPSPPAETALLILPPLERAVDVAAPPAVALPPPPPPVIRPGRPVPAEPEPDEVAPPPFIPHDTPPRLVNVEEVQRTLLDAYPEELRLRGAEGVVLLWLFVDSRGEVTRLRLQRSSGHEAFDALAQQVARRMKYRPALNRSMPVGVWVAQPIRFSVELEAGLAADPG